MRAKLILAALFGLAILAPASARAQNAYVLTDGAVRAGPSTDYPRLVVLGRGNSIDVYGCLDGWNWCDVSWRGYRGWMRADHIGYAYGGQWVPIPSYRDRGEVPIITFDFGYWDRYYQDRDFYRNRDVYYRRHPEYHHGRDRDDWRYRDHDHDRHDHDRHDHDGWPREQWRGGDDRDRDAWRQEQWRREHDRGDHDRGQRDWGRSRAYNPSMIQEEAARNKERAERGEAYRRLQSERQRDEAAQNYRRAQFERERAARSVAPAPRAVNPGADYGGHDRHGHGGGNPNWRNQGGAPVPNPQQPPPDPNAPQDNRHHHH